MECQVNKNYTRSIPEQMNKLKVVKHCLSYISGITDTSIISKKEFDNFHFKAQFLLTI